MALSREEYREQAKSINSVSAWAIRHCGGLWFAGFGGKPGGPPIVKWTGTLADARLFNASALSQAEKYIERIKAKDALYIGLKVYKVEVSVQANLAPTLTMGGQMTATPRTDAVDAVADQNYGIDLYRNMLEHARQLERELNAALICAGVASKERGEWAEERDALIADRESYRATANQLAQRVAAAEQAFENEKATSAHLEELVASLEQQLEEAQRRDHE